MMRNHPWPVWICLLLALVALTLGGSLYRIHVTGGSGPGLLGSICGEGGGCDEVVLGPWGQLPPGSESGGGIPVALLGLVHFSALVAFFAIVGWPAAGRSGVRKLALGLILAGGLGSLGWISIMAFVVKAWCPLCLGVHASNLLLVAVTLIFLRRRGADDRPVEDEKVKLSDRARWIREIEERYPERARLGAAALVFVLLAVGLEASVRASGLAARTGDLEAELASLRESEYTLEAAYANAPKLITPELEKTIIREDDPVIEARPGLRNTLVLYSDIECPSCARFDRFLFEEVIPMFEGHLRVVYKHYPLTMHEHAIPAARACEAARLQGKFWEMQSALRERRQELGSVDYGAVAESLGLDRARFLRDMDGVAVGQRILQDKNLGLKHLKVTSTPSVFLNGRPVDRKVRDLRGFWARRAEVLEKLRRGGGAGWGESAARASSKEKELLPAKR